MSTPARAIVPDASPDVSGRSFADLGPGDVVRLAAILRPLPWVDGLITAAIVAPEQPGDWLEHIWAEGGFDKLTPAEAEDLSSLAEDHFIHVCNLLFEEPEAYRPFLGNRSGEMEAAAQWAAGFRTGIRLLPEPWEPLIDDDDARAMLASIFCLERDEELAEDLRADSPFRDLSPAERDDLRDGAISILPHVVLAFNAASVELDPIFADGGVGGPEEPYVRTTPKVGRNDPCPCGSGMKYKKCCRDRLEQDC